MKKWIAPICSAVAGIFSFIMLCLDWCKMSKGAYSVEFTGWEIIKNKDDMFSNAFYKLDGYGFYKFAAIAMLVVAVLAILMAVVLVLKNLNVIKVDFNLNLINNVLLSLLVLFVILTFVALLIMSKDEVLKSLDTAAQVGAWLQLVISGAACACGWALARKAE